MMTSWYLSLTAIIWKLTVNEPLNVHIFIRHLNKDYKVIAQWRGRTCPYLSCLELDDFNEIRNFWIVN